MRSMLTAIVLLPALAACSGGDSPVLVACEDGVKFPLADKGAYRRISAVERVDNLTADEWLRQTYETDGTYRGTVSGEIRAGRQVAQRVSVRLTYSAMGTMGRPVEITTTCGYVDDDDSRDQVSFALLTYNGASFAQWVGS